MKTIAILGASDKIERTSNKAVKMLKDAGFTVLPVHPTLETLEGLPVFHSLDDIDQKVDILSIYVNPKRGEMLLNHIADLKPGSVILNPGSESSAMEMGLERSCIPYYKACTLTLLSLNKI